MVGTGNAPPEIENPFVSFITAAVSPLVFAVVMAFRKAKSLPTRYSAAEVGDTEYAKAKAEVHTPARSAFRVTKIPLLMFVATDLAP
ncbi:hypothetical protein [Phyllobacterium sp. P5_D12]